MPLPLAFCLRTGIVLLVALSLSLPCTAQQAGSGTLLESLREGDLIFQSSFSGQSLAIQQATHSPYSHMGILLEHGGELAVFEAVQPVRFTPLDRWIRRGEGGHYVVKRLKDAHRVLTPEALKKMKEYGFRFEHRDYDLYFGWSDDRLYCSELVWKIYREGAGIVIGRPEPLRHYDLSGKRVQRTLKERYGDRIPYDEPMISPGAMFDSDLLITVAEH